MWYIRVVATQIFFIFTPKIGEESHFDEYFSKGVKPPTSIFTFNLIVLCFDFDGKPVGQ